LARLRFTNGGTSNDFIKSSWISVFNRRFDLRQFDGALVKVYSEIMIHITGRIGLTGFLSFKFRVAHVRRPKKVSEGVC
ncbi:MAG: hypothetical protein ACFFCQ_02495, partial [Promethearchaeota archaeon]